MINSGIMLSLHPCTLLYVAHSIRGILIYYLQLLVTELTTENITICALPHI